MIRDAMAVELELGQMVIVSAYGRGSTTKPAHAALLTVLGGSGKVTIGIGEPEIIELITVLTRQLDNIRQIRTTHTVGDVNGSDDSSTRNT